MTAARRESLTMMLVMTALMGAVLSAWFTWQAAGFTAQFISAWAQRYFSTYLVVLPTVLLVAPFAQWVAKRLNTSPELPQSAPSPRSTALQAWEHNAAGHRGEGFAKWLAMLSDTVLISMPTGAFRGENHGLFRARAIYDAIAAASPKLIYEQPFRITESGQTVVIEFNDHGSIAGMPYRNRIAAFFDIENGKVAAYREYFGDIDPEVGALIANASASSRLEAAT